MVLGGGLFLMSEVPLQVPFRHSLVGAPTRTVDYDPFINSQPALRNYLQGLMWCKFGHVTPLNVGGTKAA